MPPKLKYSIVCRLAAWPAYNLWLPVQAENLIHDSPPDGAPNQSCTNQIRVVRTKSELYEKTFQAVLVYVQLEYKSNTNVLYKLLVQDA